MKTKLEFLFNNNRLFINKDLPDLNHYFRDIVYSSTDLLVYKKGSLEVMLSKEGAISITTYLDGLDNFKNDIVNIFSEYEYLASLNDMFKLDNSFKMLVPKENTKEVVTELGHMNFNVNIIDYSKMDILSIEKSNFF